MNIVLFQRNLTQKDFLKLTEEFPQFLFLLFNETTYHQLSPSDWQRVEIIFGNQLTEEELAKAPQLKWIHSPSYNLDSLCLEAIEARGNILVTFTKDRDTEKIAQFLCANLLAFSKGLYLWKTGKSDPEELFKMAAWPLEGKRLLQIGLGEIGTQFTHHANFCGMEVWGVDRQSTFHPYCSQTFAITEWQTLLPTADVISVAPSKRMLSCPLFDKEILTTIKEGAILLFLGSTNSIDLDALASLAKEEKFRGVYCDFTDSPPKNSPIWKIPNLLITTGIANLQSLRKQNSLSIFRYNLRQFLVGNFFDMQNLLKEELTLEEIEEVIPKEIIPT